MFPKTKTYFHETISENGNNDKLTVTINDIPGFKCNIF
jgi:hypothetical protein